MALIRGIPGAVDDAAAAWHNDIEDDRAMIWDAFGGSEGVLWGLDMTLDSGALSVTFAAGAALVEERGTDITGNTRGYYVFNDSSFQVTFDVPDASSRNDAVVIAWADPQYGSLGASAEGAGPQVIVVKGTSGSTTPRTDAQINTAVGVGGWFRYADVIIDNGDTEVNAANVTLANAYARSLTPGLSQVVKFTSSGTFDKADYPHLRAVVVEVQAGGGGGGGAGATAPAGGAGGSAGGYAKKLILASALSASETVTVGAGGGGGGGAAAGTAGGSSSFGAHATATGGAGGPVLSAASNSNASGGAPGAGSSGDVNLSGERGGNVWTGTSAQVHSGRGGSSPLGAGGVGRDLMASASSSGDDAPSNGYGAGGGGAANSGGGNATGGDGTGGVVIVEVYV